MEIHERTVDGVTVLEITGRMVLSEGGDGPFRDLIAGMIGRGHRRLLVDLSQVTQADTTALAALVGAHVLAVRRDARMKLLNPSARLRALLKITRLDTVFEICETEEQALRSFGAET